MSALSRAIFMRASSRKRWIGQSSLATLSTTWRDRGENRPTFSFCVNRRHAQHVAERFLEVGVAAEYMDGTTSREDREAVFDRFRAGETRVICNVGVLTTGVDLDVRCISMARPTKSRILFVQTIGRGLRTAEGKDRLLILDHAGNHLRLGMVTDIGQDHLDDGTERQAANLQTRERTKPLPKLCDECRCVIARDARTCSSCGADVRVRTDVESVDGELIELGSRRGGAREPEVWKSAGSFLNCCRCTSPTTGLAGPTRCSDKSSAIGRTATIAWPWSPRSRLAIGFDRGRSLTRNLGGAPPMSKKSRPAHQGQFADSAAYAVLSNEGKSLLEMLQALGREEILVEAAAGRFVKVKLSDKWRNFGDDLV